jgi:hypothetical protein
MKRIAPLCAAIAIAVAVTVSWSQAKSPAHHCTVSVGQDGAVFHKRLSDWKVALTIFDHRSVGPTCAIHVRRQTCSRSCAYCRVAQ